jgi:DNA-binding NarL/FixJ family response regulator/tRNA A-37 threonylcarbamoyl transferase component Bud32
MQMSEEPTSVLIAEDQDIMRLGLRLTLEKISGVQVVGEAADGEAATNKAKELKPAVVLMDIDLPGMNGITATQEIKRALPNTAIIMFTSDSSDESIFAALKAGADGYCLKNVSADRLSMAINSVVQGAAWLDPGVAQKVLRANAERKEDGQSSKPAADAAKAVLSDGEVEVLQMIEGGKSLEEVAALLKVLPSAVEGKVRAILENFLKSGAVSDSLSGALNANLDIAMNVASTHAPGTIIGDRYVIEEAVGSGGMSNVYRAKHKLMQRLVAIKMLHRQFLTEESQTIRFYHEAKAAGVLNHPNIVPIFDFGVTPQHQPFLVMDFVDGISLQDELDGKVMEVRRALKIFVQICDALAHAHKRSIAHRDLKPSNIMLLKADDGSDFVKLLDFGVAKFLAETNPDLHLTKTGDLFGTPLYMSPEQCMAKPTDARTDIYSLGCVMYEVLCGQVPFAYNSAYETMNAHVSEKPSRLPFLVPGRAIPVELESLVMKMLEKDPDNRPQTIIEVKDALMKIQSTMKGGS